MPSKPQQTKTSTKTKTVAKRTPSASTARTAAAKAKAPTTTRAKAPSRARVTPKPASDGDWRAQTLARMRALILEADPQMIEERKWIKPTKPLGVPVWSHGRMVCTGETYKQVVKLTFAYGASLPDPTGLFNSSLAGGTRRAIDIPEGVEVDARAFKALVKAAVALNATKKKR